MGMEGSPSTPFFSREGKTLAGWVFLCNPCPPWGHRHSFRTRSLAPFQSPGGDLYGALRRHPELLAWDKLGRKVALDVALGLHYLQSRRPPVLHRDLKSPNILLTGWAGSLLTSIFEYFAFEP